MSCKRAHPELHVEPQSQSPDLGQEAHQRLATLLPAPICARSGCGQPLPQRARRHGSPRRFCSTRCRWLAWTAVHPHSRRTGEQRCGKGGS